MFRLKCNIWEESGSCYIGQNPLDQSDCRIFNSTISAETNDDD